MHCPVVCTLLMLWQLLHATPSWLASSELKPTLSKFNPKFSTVSGEGYTPPRFRMYTPSKESCSVLLCFLVAPKVIEHGKGLDGEVGLSVCGQQRIATAREGTSR